MTLTMPDNLVLCGPARFTNPLAPPAADAYAKIVFPAPDELRARKVVTRSRFRSTGKYPSWKMGRMLQWESVHEHNAFRLLDADPQVKSFNEQPCIIEYVHGGELRKHVPDILVEFKNGTKEIWEVKTAHDAGETEIATRTSRLANSLPRLGYRYRVILAGDLGAQPQLRNAIRLLGHGFRPISELDRESMRLLFKKQSQLLWSEASHGHYGQRGLQILCRLALEGVLVVDMGAPISSGTRFVVGNGGL